MMATIKYTKTLINFVAAERPKRVWYVPKQGKSSPYFFATDSYIGDVEIHGRTFKTGVVEFPDHVSPIELFIPGIR